MDFMASHCTTGLPFHWIHARIQDKMKEGRHSGKPTNNAAPGEDYGQSSPPPRWDVCEETTTFTANTDCTTSIEVVRPYAIEEPEDDDEQANQTRESTGSTPQWQRDLVNSMDDLECESDASNSSFGSDDQARGQKRKPASTGPQDPQSAHSPPPMEAFLQPDNDHSEEPNVSPKRQCRKNKSKQSKVPLEAVDAAFLSQSFSSHETWPPGSSGSDTLFTDPGNADYVANETSMPDEMDVD